MTGYEGIFSDVGRTLVGVFFAFFGVYNGMNWRGISQFMTSKKIPLATPFLFLGITWQSVGGWMLILNLYAPIVALLLIPFVVVAVFLFHAYWNYRGEVRQLHMILFVANLAGTLGALLGLAGSQ